MSYDIALHDPVTKEPIQLEAKHQMLQGTYAVGGTPKASMNITYNYAPHYYLWIHQDDGLRHIYGMTGAESIPVLQEAASHLDDDVSENYWQNTEGNAKKALLSLIALAQLHPDGVWSGD